MPINADLNHLPAAACSSGAPVPALLFGRGLTLTGAMRSLGRSHVPLYSPRDAKDFAAQSRWQRDPPVHGFANLKPHELQNFLHALPLERAVLVPCADDWLEAVSALPEALASRFPTSLPTPDIVQTMVDKWRFAQLLNRIGIPYPRTVLLSSRDQIQSMAKEDFHWSLLKPLRSHEFGKRHGVKGYLVQDREEALRISTSLQFPVMLQEYIPGPPAATCFVDGFVDRDGVVRARFARRRLRIHPSPLGNSSLMVSIPLDEIRPAVESLDHLLASVSYRGIFSAEFKHDCRDSSFKILEINARPWWYVEFAARLGVDVCRLAYLDALGFPVESIQSYAIGRRCMYLPTDFSAYRQQRSSPHAMNFLSWIWSCAGAHDALFAWDDPAPALTCAGGFLRSLWSNRIQHRVATESANGGANAAVLHDPSRKMNPSLERP